MDQNGSKFKSFVIKHRKALISLVLCVAVAAVFIPILYRSQVNQLDDNVPVATNSGEEGSAENAVSGDPSGGGSHGQSSTGDQGSGESSEHQKGDLCTCYLEVECHTILNNIDDLTEGKEHLVPSDGVIYSGNVEFTYGQSAYDVLRDTMQASGIQMDAEYNSLYDSAYIKGINNLYEFDCGQFSGWMFSVNGEYPSYGSSVYTLSDGDKLVFSYTCDLGRDL